MPAYLGRRGSGKTSLACQVARWVMSEDAHQRPCKYRMLPVLIEQDLRGETFLEAVRGQLQDLVDEPEPIPVELLEQLLRHRRILVIVDHFSEMNETTRGQIRPELSEFPANALVVTSRIEALHQVDRTTIKPCRIEEFTALSWFMESYLMHREKRDLYSQSEFFYACGRFSAMVGARGLTVLLAKLYAEHMIAIKENADASEPRNVPELMLSYLNELNVNVAKNKLDDRTVHRDAKVVAWECLRRTFRPTSARLADTLTALGEENAQSRLEYMEDRLRLIQTIQPSQDQIRFLLDPLAEYLAAMHVVESHDGIEPRWRDFIDQANSKARGTGTIASFLLAVQDCCLSKGKETSIPPFVYQDLAEAQQG